MSTTTRTETARQATVATSAAKRCRVHTDPTRWVDDANQPRAGFIRSVCRDCGGFIGYRPVEPNASGKKNASGGGREKYE